MAKRHLSHHRRSPSTRVQSLARAASQNAARCPSAASWSDIPLSQTNAHTQPRDFATLLPILSSSNTSPVRRRQGGHGRRRSITAAGRHPPPASPQTPPPSLGFAIFHGQQLIRPCRSPQSELGACCHITPRKSPKLRGPPAVSHLAPPPVPNSRRPAPGWPVSRISSLCGDATGSPPWPAISVGFQPCSPSGRRLQRRTAGETCTSGQARTTSCTTGIADAHVLYSWRPDLPHLAARRNSPHPPGHHCRLVVRSRFRRTLLPGYSMRRSSLAVSWPPLMLCAGSTGGQ
jgi:hypothetical protein